MGAFDVEYPGGAVGAPEGEQPQIGGVADSGGAVVAGEEPGDGAAFADVEWIVVADDDSGGGCGREASLMTRSHAETGSKPCGTDRTSIPAAPARGRSRVVFAARTRSLCASISCAGEPRLLR